MIIDNAMKGIISTYVNCHNLSNQWVRLVIWALPMEEIAYKANLATAFVGAITVALFYWVVFLNFKSRITAFVSAVFFMVCHSVWWNSTIVEVYIFNALFTVIGILFFSLLRLYPDRSRSILSGLFFFSGLSIFNHVAMAFLCVGSGICLLAYLFSKKQKALETFGLCSLLFVLGFLPWLSVFLIDWYQSGNLSRTLHQAFFGPFSRLMFAGSASTNIVNHLFLLFTEFPNGYLLLIPAGFFFLFKKWGRSPSTFGLLTVLALNTIFFVEYETWNRFCHLMPSLVIMAFVGAFSVDQIRLFLIRFKQPALHAGAWMVFALAIGFTQYFYSHLSVWGSQPTSIWHKTYSNLSTDCFRTNELIANPNKRGFNDYQNYVDALFAALPLNAVYVDDDGRSYDTITTYNQKWMGRRRDISVPMMNSFGIDDASWGSSPNDLARLIERAYVDNWNIFFITLAWPLSRGIQQVPDHKKLQFEPFRVGDVCTIYRLKTSSQDTRPAEDRPNFAQVQIPQVAYSGGALKTEFKPSWAYFVKESQLVRQDMSSYGTQWMSDDQLFVRAEGVGSYTEFMLNSDRERNVQMRIQLTTSYDYGTIDILLNQVPLLRGVDLYSSNVWTKVVEIPRASLIKGRNRLTFKVTGKNPRSFGFIYGLDYLEVISP